jgi:hypothetical protein
MTRLDQAHFNWLVEHAFFKDIGSGSDELTDRAKAAADLGFYEL